MASTPRFLVIDDDEDMRYLLRCELQKEFPGSAVVECPSGSEALERHASAAFDAILTDYLLPDGDGIEFITLFRQRNTTCPVLMLTGSSDPRVHERAYAAGATVVVFGTKLQFAPIIRTLLSNPRQPVMAGPDTTCAKAS